MKCRVLHLGSLDKFTVPFWHFLEEQVGSEGQVFLYKHQLFAQDENHPNWIPGRNWTWFWKCLRYAYPAQKIVLHSLFDFRMVVFLALQPWLLKKCYWIIWGGDLYLFSQMSENWRRRLKERFRRRVIQNLGYVVTSVPGDAQLARQWYQFKGHDFDSFVYPSNLYQNYVLPHPESERYIQVGNSADPSNRHLEAFQVLAACQEQDFKVLVPLSYGNKDYAQKVIEAGRALFHDRLVPLTEFLPFEDYLVWLSRVEIAVFNHRRQQGFGNIIKLLGLGKKVYLRKEVTTYQFFKDLGVYIYELEDFDLKEMSEAEKQCNRDIVLWYASKENLIRQLTELTQ